MSLLSVGVRSSRYATRQICASSYQLTPRVTRREPLLGPVGFVCVVEA